MDTHDIASAMLVGLFLIVATSPAVAGFIFRMSVVTPLIWFGAVDMDTATAVINLHW